MDRRTLFKGAGALAATPLLAQATAANAQGKKYTFVHMLWGMSDLNVQYHIKAGEAYMAAHPNVEIKYVGPENYDPAEHAKFLDTILNGKPDGIAMHISSVDALLPGLKRAKEMGIPIVSVTSHPPGEEDNKKLEGYYITWVGADEGKVGAFMADYLLKNIAKDKPPVHAIYLMAHLGHAGQEQRAKGFFDGLPQGVKSDKVATGEEPGQAMDVIRSFLIANPDVDTIFGSSMTNKWVTDIMEELGRSDIVFLTDNAGAPTLEGVIPGKIAASFSQQFPIQAPFAYEALYNFKEVGMAPGPIITGPSIVDKSNAESLKLLEIKVFGEEGYMKQSPF